MTIVDASGDTLNLSQAVLLSGDAQFITGAFTGDAVIAGGTGKFETATGTMQFSGKSDQGEGSGGPIVFEEIGGTIVIEVP